MRNRAAWGERLAVVALLAVPAVFLAVLFVWPFARIVDLGLRPDGVLALDRATDALTDADLRGVLWFTTWQAAVSAVLTVVAGLPAAWVFGRLQFRGRRLAWSALIVPFVMPTVVVGAAFLALLGPAGPVGERLGDLRGTVWAILVAHVFFNLAVVVRTVGAAWARLDPVVEQSATMLGATRWQVATRVTLPLLAPAVLAAASLVYVFSFTSFGVVLLLGASRLRTLEVEIYERTRTLDLGSAAVLSLTQLVLIGVVLVIASRLAQRWGRALPTVTDASHRPRGAERVAMWCVLGATGVLLGGPLLWLAARSVQTGSGWGLDHYRSLGDNPRGSVLFVTPAEAIAQSMRNAAVATLVALVVGACAAMGLYRIERRSRARRAPALLDAVVMLPLGASAVTIGFGFLIALDRPPVDLRDSWWLVPLAQAMVALPFVVRSLLPALRAIEPAWQESAAVLGASGWQVWRRVELPLLRRPVVVAAGFAFAVSLGEFGATVFVARADNATLPVVLARLLGQPGSANVGRAMAVATVLMVVSAGVMLAMERLREGERSAI